MNETRREFVLRMGWSVVAMGLVVGLSRSGPGDDRESAFISRLEALVPNTANTRQIGRGFLESSPRENDRAGLVRTLEMKFGGPDGVDLGAYRTVVSREFGEDRFSDVGGWYLSMTELKICALYELSSKP